jgi:hypothetical protein
LREPQRTGTAAVVLSDLEKRRKRKEEREWEGKMKGYLYERPGTGLILLLAQVDENSVWVRQKVEVDLEAVRFSLVVVARSTRINRGQINRGCGRI